MVSAPFDVAWGAATDRGLKRAHNEDSYFACPPVFLVADGMGGHQGGDVASRAVVEAFEVLSGDGALTSEALLRTVTQAVGRVRSIASSGRAPGTTLTGVGLASQGTTPCWLVFNIGDSRTYRLSRGVLEQVSVDHSEVQAMVDAGALKADQAQLHEKRNVVTRALGGGIPGAPIVDQWLLIARPNDRMLLCSDGLSTELTDQFLMATLQAVSDPQAAAEALVAAAVQAGGRDNVTAVVVDAVGGPFDDDVDLNEDTLSEEILIDIDGNTIPHAAFLDAGVIDA
jgi:PPM family protein phosphatase